MIAMIFTSQIILLVIGFGAGYLLLITAKNHGDNLKQIGEALGWVLIAATIFLTVISFFYSVQMANNYNSNKYCPINKTTPAQPQTNSTINQEEPEEQGVQEDQEVQDETQDLPPTTQNRPIKRDIKDHE